MLACVARSGATSLFSSLSCLATRRVLGPGSGSRVFSSVSHQSEIRNRDRDYVEDPYQTRLRGTDFRVIERGTLDPITPDYGLPGPLTAQQLDDFVRDGYLVLHDVVEAKQVEELYADALSRRVTDAKDRLIVEPNGDPDNPNDIKSVFAVAEDTASPIGRLVTGSSITRMAQQLLAGDVCVHQSRVNFKPAFVGKGFTWHSDFETWHSEDGMPRPRALSVAVSLTDNFPYNGPLMLVPGSHNMYVACPGETPKDNWRYSLRHQKLGSPPNEAIRMLVEQSNTGIVQALGKAGSIVIFDCNIMHGSSDNISPDPRTNVFFVYNRADNQLREPFAGTKARPDFIAHRSPPVIRVGSVV